MDTRVALVIGTFAAVPYVHLALEAWRSNYPEIPVLVHDDASPRSAELDQLCTSYGVAFATSVARARRTVGDLSAFVSGFEFANVCGAQLLVKMSRRFIALKNWVPGLRELAYQTQYATYSNRCTHFRFGFRTECIALHVESWRCAAAIDELRERVAQNEPVFVEGFIHDLCRSVHRMRCEANRVYEIANPRTPDSDGYGIWDIMPHSRLERSAGVLWHDCNSPRDYALAAKAYGLPYSESEFDDPNDGCGLGDE